MKLKSQNLKNFLTSSETGKSSKTLLLKRFLRPYHHERQGFALVVTLTLMILLSVLVVGLMSLSAITLRANASQDSSRVAKSNARLALNLALAQLQKTLGSDKAISAPATILKSAKSETPRGLTAAWSSWALTSPTSVPSSYETEIDKKFLGYLTSDMDSINGKASSSKIPETDTGSIQLVGDKSAEKSALSTGASTMSASVIRIETTTGDSKAPSGSVAWATMDEGVKARADLVPLDDKVKYASTGAIISSMGSSERNRFDSFNDLNSLQGNYNTLSSSLPKYVSSNSLSTLSGDAETTKRYFHDLTCYSQGLQTDPVNGGFKTDLSVLFGVGATSSSSSSLSSITLPSDYANLYVYHKKGDTSFYSRAEPKWSLLANYANLYMRTVSSDNPMAGMKSYVSSSRYSVLQTTDKSTGLARTEPNLANLTEPVLMPTLLRMDMVFSLVTHTNSDQWAKSLNASYPNTLYMQYVPIFTLHNPYNVPLKFTEIEVEMANIPVGFNIKLNGNPINIKGVVPVDRMFFNQYSSKTKIYKFLLGGTLKAGQTIDTTMNPGETMIFGIPFDKSFTWEKNIVDFFDYMNDKTGNNGTPGKMIKGLISTNTSSVGYAVDWLCPTQDTAGSGYGPTSEQNKRYKSGTGNGVVGVNDSDVIDVIPAPAIPYGNATNFYIKLRARRSGTSTDYSSSQIYYKDLSHVTTALGDGTSSRFPKKRDFTKSVTAYAKSIYEGSGTAVSAWFHPKPIALFTVGTKTTSDSFTSVRPTIDSGFTNQSNFCDVSTGTAGASSLEFALTDLSNGTAPIENNNTMAYAFTANGNTTSTKGINKAIFYEIPAAPFQTVAQFRNINIGGLGGPTSTTYTVGESYAHPAIPSGSVVFTSDTTKIFLDHNWLANYRLWDSYWFSTLSPLKGPAYGTKTKEQTTLASEFFSGSTQLPNPRNTPYLPSGVSAETAADSEHALTKGGAKSANYILTNGAFNVNSTSVEAWKAVLSSGVGTQVATANNGNVDTRQTLPLSRTRYPYNGKASSSINKETYWTGFQTLDEGQIDTLAKKIVDEVKKRGPFLSLGQFVNRQLAGSTELTVRGALQAAIDNAKINSSGADGTVDTTKAANYGWKNLQAAQTGNTSAGAPSEMTQGDLLTSIGSFITVRSDTFKIRAYGDARDKNNGVSARAWCEAVVQRLPEYVDSKDDASTAYDNLKSDTNKVMGRRFVVISFRWLNENEI
jgi:Tfp pilus assembly protein PilX